VKCDGIPLLSFFVGGGLLDMGFEQAGFEIVWTNECEPAFIRGYESGIAAWRLSRNDTKPAQITCTSRIEFTKSNQIFSQAFGNRRPGLFGIIGGSPCPDFSMAGKNGGREGENGKLSEVFVRRICRLSPDFFVLENVPGLWLRHREFFLEILRRFRNDPAKYVCDWTILNALEFGVPQNRKRLFVVGVKPGLFQKYFHRQPKLEEEGWFPWPTPKYPDAISKYSWPEVNDSDRAPRKPQAIPSELMAGTYLNGNNPPENHPNGNDMFRPYSPRFQETLEGDISHKSFKRLHRWRYSPTAAYGNNEVHLHPWEERRLSVREVMRLQSVPDEYALPDEITLSAKFKMIANGVPVRLSKVVADALRVFLEMPCEDQNASS